MTAPRTNIADELDGRNNDDIARQFGLSPVTPGEPAPQQPPAPVDPRRRLIIALQAASSAPQGANHPAPVTQQQIDGITREMKAWEHRGGIVSPNSDFAKMMPVAAKSLTTPAGYITGGEFSDEDEAAYLDADKKLALMKDAVRNEPIIRAGLKAATAPSDVTRTTRAKP